MTTFDDRERQEESKFRHEQELGFRIRNRRNKLLGLWAASEFLGLTGQAATDYAKTVVLADFESPGDADVMRKLMDDVAAAGGSLTDHALARRARELEVEARQQVMTE